MATNATGYGRLQFREQIEYFRRKRNVLTDSYLDVFGAEHDVAFMVAGANRDDLLADLREAVRKAIEDGATLAQFRTDFDRIVARYGWDYTGGRNWRTRVIYETNMRQSYNAGRWEQLQRAKRTRPFWQYRHNDAVEHPRPIHQGWDGLVLHADDPWWHTHFPANGYGCQCYVEPLNERDLRRMGKPGADQAPPVNWQAVTIGQRSPGGPRTVMTPEGIDPGFAYAPGSGRDGWPAPIDGGPVTPPSLRSQLAGTAQQSLQKTLRLPAEAAAESAKRATGLRRVIDALDAAYAGRLANAGDDAPGYFVGAIAPGVVRSMAGRGLSPAAAAIHAPASAGLPASLPSLLSAPDAVLLDPATGDLYYLVGRGRVLRVDTRSTPSTIESAGMTATDIRTRARGGLLDLLQGAL